MTRVEGTGVSDAGSCIPESNVIVSPVSAVPSAFVTPRKRSAQRYHHATRPPAPLAKGGMDVFLAWIDGLHGGRGWFSWRLRAADGNWMDGGL